MTRIIWTFRAFSSSGWWGMLYSAKFACNPFDIRLPIRWVNCSIVSHVKIKASEFQGFVSTKSPSQFFTRKKDVSKNNGTPKSSHFNRVFHYKPSILGVSLFFGNTQGKLWISLPNGLQILPLWITIWGDGKSLLYLLHWWVVDSFLRLCSSTLSWPGFSPGCGLFRELWTFNSGCLGLCRGLYYLFI